VTLQKPSAIRAMSGLLEEIERLKEERHQYAISISTALGGDITKTTFERITELREEIERLKAPEPKKQ
jgi:uncharacterized small protein (DUF1192 family)